MSLISKVFVLLTRLSHSALETTVTMVVLFVTRLASEIEPLTDWLDPQLVLHDPTDHAQSKKTRKFLSSQRNHSSKVDSSSWRWVRMGLFFNNSWSCKWPSYRPKPLLYGLSLKKSLIKSHATLFQVGSSSESNTTRLHKAQWVESKIWLLICFEADVGWPNK